LLDIAHKSQEVSSSRVYTWFEKKINFCFAKIAAFWLVISRHMTSSTQSKCYIILGWISATGLTVIQYFSAYNAHLCNDHQVLVGLWDKLFKTVILLFLLTLYNANVLCQKGVLYCTKFKLNLSYAKIADHYMWHFQVNHRALKSE